MKTEPCEPVNTNNTIAESAPSQDAINLLYRIDTPNNNNYNNNNYNYNNSNNNNNDGNNNSTAADSNLTHSSLTSNMPYSVCLPQVGQEMTQTLALDVKLEENEVNRSFLSCPIYFCVKCELTS